jgi:hypothetical protein
MEQIVRIELTQIAWKAIVLPLDYICEVVVLKGHFCAVTHYPTTATGRAVLLPYSPIRRNPFRRLRLVSVARLELATSRLKDGYSFQLSYTNIARCAIFNTWGALVFAHLFIKKAVEGVRKPHGSRYVSRTHIT